MNVEDKKIGIYFSEFYQLGQFQVAFQLEEVFVA